VTESGGELPIEARRVSEASASPGSVTPPLCEPQQTIAGLSGVWPANRGRVTLSDDFHERALEQPIRGSCARCGASFIGLFRDEREWFKAHRRRCA
jgi:hypothetical protein